MKLKIKKVIAQIEEIYVEPEFEAIYNCPYCDRKHHDEIYDDDFNKTEIKTCHNNDCKQKFKVKIPKLN